MKRALSFLAFLCLPVAPAHAQDGKRGAMDAAAANPVAPVFGQKLQIAGIHNAGKISEVLYRGAQPKDHGLAELKKLGISTIVDLRGEGQYQIQWEKKEAESLGMRFVHIPVSGWSPPTNAQVGQFLALFRDDPKQKVFVHCRFGDDRTGVFVATYRMAIDKWDDQQAMKEMYFFGFNGFWHPAMKTFIHEFPSRLKYSPALATLQLVPGR